MMVKKYSNVLLAVALLTFGYNFSMHDEFRLDPYGHLVFDQDYQDDAYRDVLELLPVNLPEVTSTTIAARAQKIIADVFKSIDDWISTPTEQRAKLAYSSLEGVLNQLASNLKINSQDMQPIKNAVKRAILAFSTEMTIESNIDNKILKTIVDSLKISLLAPVQLAIQLGATGAGITLGGVGGAITGASIGIKKTALDMAEVSKKMKLNMPRSLQDAALFLPKAVVVTLSSVPGLVATPFIAAYAAAEGVVYGGAVGYFLTEPKIGTIFELKKNPDLEDFIDISLDQDNLSEKNSVSARAQKIINNVFKAMDDWINLSARERTMSAIDMFNTAFDNLASLLTINADDMQPMKSAVLRSIEAFTTESSMNNKVLQGIVNSTKMVLLAPVKLAIQSSTIGTGIALGSAGGALTGFGMGMKLTGEIADFIEFNVPRSFKEAALLLPKTIIISLTGVVATPLLTSYAAAEGVYLGAVAGRNLAQKRTGDIFTLRKTQVLDNSDPEQIGDTSTVLVDDSSSKDDNLSKKRFQNKRFQIVDGTLKAMQQSNNIKKNTHVSGQLPITKLSSNTAKTKPGQGK